MNSCYFRVHAYPSFSNKLFQRSKDSQTNKQFTRITKWHTKHIKPKLHIKKLIEIQEPNYTHLSEFRSASLPISTKDPGITQTRPIIATTHSLTSLATLLRGIELEVRTPLHSITPKLHILNPSTTSSIIFPCNSILFKQFQRLNMNRVVLPTWCEKHREE